MAFTLSSTAFRHKGRIPDVYTCKGKNINPPLHIEGAPNNTTSLALITDDPDAPMGTWDHWVIWNIPPTSTEIIEAKEPQGVAGMNSWGKTCYGGPCPPSGTHRYFFKIYALDTLLELPRGSKKVDLERAMKGHILAKAELLGIYSTS